MRFHAVYADRLGLYWTYCSRSIRIGQIRHRNGARTSAQQFLIPDVIRRIKNGEQPPGSAPPRENKAPAGIAPMLTDDHISRLEKLTDDLSAVLGTVDYSSRDALRQAALAGIIFVTGPMRPS